MSILAESARATAPAVVRLLCFELDALRLALPLYAVIRVLRSVEVTPLPGAPAAVLGAVNIAGEVLAVLDLRQRFPLPPRALSPDQQLLIACAGHRSLAVLVDQVQGVVDYPAAQVVPSSQVLSEGLSVQGLLRLDDGLLLINDPERFLSLDEAQALDRAFAAAQDLPP